LTALALIEIAWHNKTSATKTGAESKWLKAT